MPHRASAGAVGAVRKERSISSPSRPRASAWMRLPPVPEAARSRHGGRRRNVERSGRDQLVRGDLPPHQGVRQQLISWAFHVSQPVPANAKLPMNRYPQTLFGGLRCRYRLKIPREETPVPVRVRLKGGGRAKAVPCQHHVSKPARLQLRDRSNRPHGVFVRVLTASHIRRRSVAAGQFCHHQAAWTPRCSAIPLTMPDLTKSPRRFPRPWTVDDATESFCIRDANGQALAYVYFKEADSTDQRNTF